MSYTTFILSALEKKNQRNAISATPEQKERAKIRLSEIDKMKMTWGAVELKMLRDNLIETINS